MLAYLQTGWHYLWNILRPRHRLGWRGFVVLGVIALAVVLVTSPMAHVADAPWTDSVVNFISNIILWIATLFLKLAIFCLTFIIEVAGYNGFLDSTAVNYGWVMVRDLTNMIFVVILLLIAFGTILGIEQYEWKKMLVKFVAAAILVNFSRIICGVMIDVGQVVMITFINGVAATAGGNLINAFGAGEIMSLAEGGSTAGTSGEVFMAAVMAVVFAGMMLMTMLVYLVILIARMIQLWVLIVLSPFAFVFSVIPTTQKYASEWWTKFGSNVVSGPIIAFFLWLSFVTVGQGTVGDEVKGASQVKKNVQGDESAGITKAMSWAKMANFAIAIGMLLVGAETAQKLGVTGGSMMSKVGDFGKKVATIASGVALGQWVGGKAKQGVLAGGKYLGKGLYNTTIGHRLEARMAGYKLNKEKRKEKWNNMMGGKEAGAFGKFLQVGRQKKKKEELERQLKVYEGKVGSAVNVVAEKAETDSVEGEGEVRKAISDGGRQANKNARAIEVYQTDEKLRESYKDKMGKKMTTEIEVGTAKARLDLEIVESKGGYTEALYDNRTALDALTNAKNFKVGQAQTRKAEAAEAMDEDAEFIKAVEGLNIEEIISNAENAKVLRTNANKLAGESFSGQVMTVEETNAVLAADKLAKDAELLAPPELVAKAVAAKEAETRLKAKFGGLGVDPTKADEQIKLLEDVVKALKVKGAVPTEVAAKFGDKMNKSFGEGSANLVGTKPFGPDSLTQIVSLLRDGKKMKAKNIGDMVTARAANSPELQAAKYKAMGDDEAIFAKMRGGRVSERVKQRIIGDPIGIKLPEDDGITAINEVYNQLFKHMKQPDLVQAHKDILATSDRLKTEAGAKGVNYEQSDVGKKQHYREMAIGLALQKGRYLDDVTGGSEEQIATKLHKLNGGADGASIQEIMAKFGKTAKALKESGRVQAETVTSGLNSIIGQLQGQTGRPEAFKEVMENLSIVKSDITSSGDINAIVTKLNSGWTSEHQANTGLTKEQVITMIQAARTGDEANKQLVLNLFKT